MRLQQKVEQDGKSISGIVLVVALVLDVAFILEDEEDDENEDEQTVWNLRKLSNGASGF
ncbi:MAG: hypothetical protein AAB676_18180 [Verrucomicrobiota bacterium]